MVKGNKISMLIFTYGTLKSKYGNNGLLAGASMIREDRVHGFKLLDSGFPVARAADGCIITGEVWDIGDPKTDAKSQSILDRLDRLEGYRKESPESSMYTREVIRTEHDVECHMYVGNVNSFRSNRDWPCVDKVYTWSY